MRAARTKALAQAVLANSSLAPTSIPRYFQSVVGTRRINVAIVPPSFKTKDEYLKELNDKPFIQMYQTDNLQLLKFSRAILQMKPNEESPYLNPNLDIVNPGPSAFDVSLRGGTHIHVQIRRCDEAPQLFQLDYFAYVDNEPPVLRMILLCDISVPSEPKADIIYFHAIYFSEREKYKSVLATTLRDCMIYLRPWDYDISNKICTIGVPRFFTDPTCFHGKSISFD